MLQEIIALYEALLTTLQKLATEKGWDCKTANSHALYEAVVTDATFIVALNIFSYAVQLTKPLSIMFASNISKHHKAIYQY